MWCANTNTVAQRTQYYPSGLPFAYDRTVDHPDLQHRKYNGKEFIEMHGYDTYDIVWRQYYPAIGRFLTQDPESEGYYSISPYTMCEDNTIRNIDPDGRDGWDVLHGASEAFLDDANLNPNVKPLSNSSNPDNKNHYTIGQAIGHFGAAVIGAFETIHGGGTAAGGAGVAIAGSESVVAVPYGTAIAIVGAAEAGHGMMLMAKATKGTKNLVEETKKVQEKKQVSSERQAKRQAQAQTENGKNRTGKSNTVVKGDHNNLKNGKAKKGDHDIANARRAKEQRKAEEIKNKK